jgi:hypothetical protein
MATSTHKPRHAILPSLPEHLSARLFCAATQHHLKAGEPLFIAGDSGGPGDFVGIRICSGIALAGDR